MLCCGAGCAVRGADVLVQLRFQKLWGPRQRSGTVVVVREPIEVPHDTKLMT